MEMFDQPFVALIFLGLALKSAGFLVRDELMLRTLVVAGTVCDMIFYLLQSPPIFGSVLTNSILAAINFVIIMIVIVERSTWFMSSRERIMFSHFKTLSPGQFRRVKRLSIWQEATGETILLREGERADRLYFIEAETFCVIKQGQRYEARGPAFAGEIMLLQGGVASAAVTVEDGAVYAVWEADRLRRAMHRSRALENALVARFGHDLADKVRNSIPMPVPLSSAAE